MPLGTVNYARQPDYKWVQDMVANNNRRQEIETQNGQRFADNLGNAIESGVNADAAKKRLAVEDARALEEKNYNRMSAEEKLKYDRDRQQRQDDFYKELYDIMNEKEREKEYEPIKDRLSEAENIAQYEDKSYNNKNIEDLLSEYSSNIDNKDLTIDEDAYLYDKDGYLKTTGIDPKIANEIEAPKDGLLQDLSKEELDRYYQELYQKLLQSN